MQIIKHLVEIYDSIFPVFILALIIHFLHGNQSDLLKKVISSLKMFPIVFRINLNDTAILAWDPAYPSGSMFYSSPWAASSPNILAARRASVQALPEMLFPQIPTELAPSQDSGLSSNVTFVERFFLASTLSWPLPCHCIKSLFYFLYST